MRYFYAPRAISFALYPKKSRFMKHPILFLPVLLLCASLFSCGGHAETPAADGGAAPAAGFVFDAKNFEGEYVGAFGDGHIVLVLSYVQGKNVSGYNVHKGLRRNLKGSLTETGGEYHFLLNEPGDNKFDGVFDFTLNPADFTGKGTWTPNDKAVTKAKPFTLKERVRDSSEDQFSGYWDGAEMLLIKPDGIVEMEYWEPVPGKADESEQHTLRGQWMAEGETITIEWPKNSYNHGEKYVLKLTKEEDGFYGLVDKNKKRAYYQFAY